VDVVTERRRKVASTWSFFILRTEYLDIKSRENSLHICGTYVYMYMCVCMYVCVYMYVYLICSLLYDRSVA
jgi:hypothetical protein